MPVTIEEKGVGSVALPAGLPMSPRVFSRKRAARVGLLHANAAPRCEHIKMSGEQCGGPALHGETMCRFHAEAMSPDVQLPLPEDAASILVGLTRVLRGLQERRCDIRESMAMLYALQIAASTLKRLHEEMPGADFEEEESPLRELMEHLRDDARAKKPNTPSPGRELE